MYKATAFINGVSVNSGTHTKEESQKFGFIEIISPIDNSVIGTIPELGEDDIKKAFESAKIAYEKWKKIDYRTRIKYLMAFAVKLREHAGILTQILRLETGKTEKNAYDEIMRSVDYIIESSHSYADIVDKPEEYNYENNILIPKNINAICVREPLGVALTMSPFNYPINLMITKIVPAILTGNTVVHKSATQGSISGWYVAKLFHELTVDDYLITPGVLNYITGKGSAIGNWLVKDKDIKSFSFTGSTKIGQFLSKSFPFTPVQLELGGHNPSIILKDANLGSAVNLIVKGAFGFSGQRCTSLKSIWLSNSIYEKFIEILESELKNIKLEEPLINKDSVDLLKEYYEDALSKGAKIIGNPLSINGNFVTPVILSNLNKDMKICNEEVFSPVLLLNKFDDVEEVINEFNSSRYGLQASIFTENIDEASRLSLKIDYGRVNINTYPSRSPDILPFGGVRDSGIGTQGIKNSLYFFTREKVIVFKKNSEE